MLARSLVQLLPPQEKSPLRSWFRKLGQLTESEKDTKMRDEYMWFILMMLQCQKIREPFNKNPPPEIEPLRDLVPAKVYEEILVANSENMTWLDKTNLEQEAEKVESDRYKTCPAGIFLENQPHPQEGIICYLAAFSDQSYP
ncbi:hypothetical protein GWI33_011705 [Rhynchophorus ferrugineus]|uniref:DUF4485 domain-containing protein n=1 Tax=Rhynchophorus ferrugineus TaxID=354439 RepID=A0A834MJX3_RHYFE|nr:hypothetical protein GWI33_011705 [Rhynchophorus ferrugineus]